MTPHTRTKTTTTLATAASTTAASSTAATTAAATTAAAAALSAYILGTLTPAFGLPSPAGRGAGGEGLPQANTALCSDAPPPPARPNIIFILTDDLGYGDIGVFYQNARAAAGDPAHATPNLDRMAAEGAKLTAHYCAAPVSAPSRASFLTGLSQGHANVRDNQFDKALADNHTVATVLRHAGYATAAFGKWGVQGKAEAPDWPAHPLNRGFDYYYGYMRHADGHEHYPKEQPFLNTKNERSEKNEKNKKKGRQKDADLLRVWDNKTNVTAGLDKCYTTDLFAARAKQWIIDQNKNTPAKPFFIYLAFDTPHAILQLPPCPYPAGGGLKGGLQWLGTPGRMINTATGKIDSWTHPDYASKPWPEVNKRYAASVRRIDDTVGDIIQLLKDLGIDQNTLIVFTSDNGPSKESYLATPCTPQFFSSFGPFSGIKRDALDGGLRVPAIARWPGRIPAGLDMTTPAAMYDWLPTFAEAARLAPPANTDGRSLITPLTATPSTPATPATSSSAAATSRTGAPGDYLYFEYFNNTPAPDYSEFAPQHRNRARNQMQALRIGDLMAVRYNIKSGQDDFEIYKITNDPKESRDLAKTPEGATLQPTLKALALQSRRPDATAPRPYDDDPVPALAPAPADTAPGLAWSYYEGDFPWTPDTAALRPAQTGISANGPDITAAPLRKNAASVIAHEGCINIPVDGEYTFELTAGTAALLRLHAATLIDADYGYKPGAPLTATILLKAGLHPIKLTSLADGKRPPALTLRWSGPGIALQPIPAAAFRSPRQP